MGTGAQDEGFKSDDSISVFEHNLRELLLGFQEDRVVGQLEQHQVTKRSERQKKPSTKWNENAGFVAKVPRFAKKKVTPGETLVGTSSKPLLIFY